MKKLIALTGLAVILLLGACERADKETITTTLPSPNRVVVIPSDGKTASTTIFLSQIGHDGRYCSGCVLYDGDVIHMDCMGDGHYCAFAAAVRLEQDDSGITATTTDTFGITSQDFFLIPDRSLNYTDKDNYRIFLNIPSQLIYRDPVTLQFTFTGLFFSEAAAYSNN